MRDRLYRDGSILSRKSDMQQAPGSTPGACCAFREVGTWVPSDEHRQQEVLGKGVLIMRNGIWLYPLDADRPAPRCAPQPPKIGMPPALVRMPRACCAFVQGRQEPECRPTNSINGCVGKEVLTMRHGVWL